MLLKVHTAMLTQALIMMTRMHTCVEECVHKPERKSAWKDSFELVLCYGRWTGISTQTQTISARNRVFGLSQGMKKLAYCRTLNSSERLSKQTLAWIASLFPPPWCTGCGSRLWQARLPVSDSSPGSTSASLGQTRRPCTRWQPPLRRLLLLQPPCPAACLARSSGNRTHGRCPCHSPLPPRRTWWEGEETGVSSTNIKKNPHTKQKQRKTRETVKTNCTNSHSHTYNEFVFMHSTSWIMEHIRVGISRLYPPPYHHS